MRVAPRKIVMSLVFVGATSAAFFGCGASGDGGDTGTGGTTSSTGGTTGSGGVGSGGAGTSGSAGRGGGAGSSSTAGTTGAAGTAAGSGGSVGGDGAGTGGSNVAGAGGNDPAGRGGSGATGGSGTAGRGGAESGRGGSDSGGRGGGAGTNAGGGRGGATGTAGTGGATGTAGTTGNGGSGSVTCPSPALKAGDTNKTIQVGSDSRSYILHVPSKYTGTAAVPLVVDFHPLGGSGMSEMSSPYKALTDAEGVITAYPNGKSGPSGGAWNVGPCCVANVDDVAFARALVADVEKVTCIDTKRVYAVGFSMGGGMSHYVACHAADVFAAVAPASFDLLQENEGGCTPPRPIAQVSFRSSNDTLVPYAGGASSVVAGMPVTFLGAKATMDKWAQINGCTGSPTAVDSNNCQYYTTCSAGVQVGLCTMTSGHAPGKADVGWPFLKKFTLP
jgi:polyhydroxybutyrate depolymerase